jgi:hypothetical protein
LAIGASRSFARSPLPPAPRIRFLFIGPHLRSALPSHGWSPFRSCASLRSRRPANGGTFTLKRTPMLGAQKQNAPVR